eukprot:CAMPEP_0204839858 /NCGR_PEP_ID=MMETSP1346-20131115/35774_1 /ASSEMBLY_ACC=CAM_ASM_000771 /TAXON_ID=215587 /ORGANISM="Aplanochytrium stocchinoi, Strain GSBS06" /LENGTH=42 /DNA_ID= /DNA_START= /DNA_END= /DNA_ORIENTATION=
MKHAPPTIGFTDFILEFDIPLSSPFKERNEGMYVKESSAECI